MGSFGPGDSFGGGGFDFMFSVFPFLFVIVFVVIIGGIVFSMIKYFRNSSAPQESTYARIVSKRMDVRHSTNHNHNHDHNHLGHTSSSSRTYYYITLEFDNGSRREFLDVKNLFGLVVEGDVGYAATKGEWIVAFERSASNNPYQQL